MRTIGDKSLQALSKLTIKEVSWNNIYSIGFTLSDDQTCKAEKYAFTNNYIFDQAKKITRVEVIIRNDEFMILRINFYHQQQRLVMLGETDDEEVNYLFGRVEVFEIDEDEQLIGCEIDYCQRYFRGLTWLKMKTIV